MKYYKTKIISYAINLPRDLIMGIDYSAKRNNVDKEVLFAIIILEVINRGDSINKFIEKATSIFFPKLLLKIDASLGIGQVKISNATLILNENNKKLVMKKLLNPTENIEIVAQFLSYLINTYKIEDKNYAELINLYLTGKIKPNSNEYIDTHYKLFSWSTEIRLYTKLFAISHNINI
ncbi:hypothetical protein E2R51_02275 [Jeotgalibacillus sp. S-D1]|uniref:transglycosylase SLT domain-containing protein n=1 Tax=Jeotgalibacillus sp. S-D1 TaxID=2552189 RepID=UPI0010597A38|nr:transglycosylase SLT domain-containing protein [Jeotgalibacillus sp. S-D1]TDL34563.1 hypothetical protein E2R51_02275 [Jeotgalibacillus sp. S-D1]